MAIVAASAQRRELERFGGPEPDHMLGVVLQRVAGPGVREDGEAAAMRDQPRDHLGGFFGRYGKLATAARMRADRIVVHAADLHTERVARLETELLRLRASFGIVIDVGVVAGDRAHDL